MQQLLQANTTMTEASCMSLDDRTSARVERSNNSTAVAAMMITIFERANQVRDASETTAEAYKGSPGAISSLAATP